MKTIIIGAGGHGKVILDILLSYMPAQSIAGFADDYIAKGTVINNYRVLDNIDNLLKAISVADYQLALGIGDNNIRQQIYKKTVRKGFIIVTPVHPGSIISPTAKIGDGTAIMGGAVINASSDIGKASIINTGATVDHDCGVGDWVHISPGANLAGGVSVGNNSHIGIGACVIGGIKIGVNCRVGAGAAVISDIDDGLTVVGVPARLRKDNE